MPALCRAKLALVAWLFGLVRYVAEVKGPEVKKPNFVFILVDDLGFNDIGYHAKDYESAIRTPFIDELANNGIKLGNYYVLPRCSPTRGALLTGRYDIHIGLQHKVIKPVHTAGLSTKHKLMPEQLRKCGYDTHMVGKWHLGHSKTAYLPQNRGFNTFSGVLVGGDHFTRNRCQLGMCAYDWRTEEGPSNDTFGEYSTHLFTARAIEAIEKRDTTKPFFLYLAHLAAHSPLQAPEKYLRQYSHITHHRRAQYAAMVATIDESVRNLTTYLKNAGLLEDTVIVFSTDNGGEKREGGNNWPLRGMKATMWEGGVKGVGFAYGKPLIQRGVTNNGLMHVTDWLPTFLRAAECTSDIDNLDGFDQWDSLTQLSPSPRKEVLHTIDPMWPKTNVHNNSNIFDTSVRAAIQVGSWKLLTGDAGYSARVPPPESSKYNLDNTVPVRAGAKLFNLENDPTENFDVSSFYPEVVNDLLKRLTFYNSSSVPSIYSRRSIRQSELEALGGYWGPWKN